MREYVPFAVTFLVSLLVGIDRERSHPRGDQAMGSRSFVLIGILGTVAGWVPNNYISAIIAVFSLSTIIMGYLRSTSKRQAQPDIGLTTELAAGLTFGIGFLSNSNPSMSLLLGLGLLVILVSRNWLHHFSRESLQPSEIKAAVILLVFLLGVLPFLPNRTLDQWNLFNPSRLGLLMGIIALLQFGGYILDRLFGHNAGILMSGFLGGLVSSTATVANLLNRSRHKQITHWPLVAGVCMATAGTLLELVLVLLTGGSPLYPLLGTLVFVSSIGALIASYASKQANHTHFKSTHQNPLDIPSVIKITLIIFVLLTLTKVAQHSISSEITWLLSFLGGLFELQVVCIAMLSLFREGSLTLPQIYINIGLAVCASFLTKFVLVSFIGRGSNRGWSFLALLGMFLSGVLGFLLIYYKGFPT